VRELQVDWAALHSAFQMNVPEVRCFFSTESGEILKISSADPQLAEVRTQPDRYVPIEAVPPRIQYQWLDEFVQTIEDETLKGRMIAAINGKGAFRRFKDILLTLPDEWRRWFEFRDQKMRDRLAEWVREYGVEPTNEPPWVDAPASVLPQAAPNSPRDVEALRDLLIAWAGERTAEQMVDPLNLEALANEVSSHFKIKPRV
jgi:hypothetical protein